MVSKKSVIFIGVGEVGKTTLVWRLIGLSLTPHATQRPGVYRIYHNGQIYELIDVPGQHATEVAQAAARSMTVFFDRAFLMYDLTRLDTLTALYDIMEHLCVFSRCLSAKEVWVVGNKRDLAEKFGVEYEPDFKLLKAQRYVKI
mgnify:FL=1